MFASFNYNLVMCRTASNLSQTKQLSLRMASIVLSSQEKRTYFYTYPAFR